MLFLLHFFSIFPYLTCPGQDCVLHAHPVPNVSDLPHTASVHHSATVDGVRRLGRLSRLRPRTPLPERHEEAARHQVIHSHGRDDHSLGKWRGPLTPPHSGDLLPDCFKVQDREVVVTMNHVSIEPDRIDSVVKDPETLRMASEWK